MLVRRIFCKPDNGSQSQWQRWTGREVNDDYLYSCGEIYVQLQEIEGQWVFRYRPYFGSLSLPAWINSPMDELQAVRTVEDFADWVIANRRELVAQLESYEA